MLGQRTPLRRRALAAGPSRRPIRSPSQRGRYALPSESTRLPSVSLRSWSPEGSRPAFRAARPGFRSAGRTHLGWAPRSRRQATIGRRVHHAASKSARAPVNQHLLAAVGKPQPGPLQASELAGRGGSAFGMEARVEVLAATIQQPGPTRWRYLRPAGGLVGSARSGHNPVAVRLRIARQDPRHAIGDSPQTDASKTGSG